MPINFLQGKLPQSARPVSLDPVQIEPMLWQGLSGKLAFDVGANIGQSLWHMVEQFDDVVALEPAHESFRALNKVWGEFKNVHLRMEAVSDQPGMLETSLREHQIHQGQLVATGLPYKKFLPGITDPRDCLPWGREIGTRSVPAVTLDWLAGNYGIPDLVKLDTNGYEGHVLRGAKDILHSGHTSFLIEFYSKAGYEECLTLLGEASYGPEVVRHPGYQPGSEMWGSNGWIKAMAPSE